MGKNYGKKATKRQGGNIFGQLILIGVAFFFGYLSATVFDYSQLCNWINGHVLAQKTPPASPKAIAKAPLPKPKFEFYTLLTNDRVRSAVPNPANNTNPAVIAQMPATPQAVNTIQLTNNSEPSASPAAPINLTVTQKLPLHAPFASEPKTSNRLAEMKEAYLVQVASFRNLHEAERMKASLVMKGFDVNITSVNQQSTNWYRITIGPFASKIEAQKAQLAFARSEHIMGMIRKMDA